MKRGGGQPEVLRLSAAAQARHKHAHVRSDGVRAALETGAPPPAEAPGPHEGPAPPEPRRIWEEPAAHPSPVSAGLDAASTAIQAAVRGHAARARVAAGLERRSRQNLDTWLRVHRPEACWVPASDDTTDASSWAITGPDLAVEANRMLQENAELVALATACGCGAEVLRVIFCVAPGPFADANVLPPACAMRALLTLARSPAITAPGAVGTAAVAVARGALGPRWHPRVPPFVAALLTATTAAPAQVDLRPIWAQMQRCYPTACGANRGRLISVLEGRHGPTRTRTAQIAVMVAVPDGGVGHARLPHPEDPRVMVAVDVPAGLRGATGATFVAHVPTLSTR